MIPISFLLPFILFLASCGEAEKKIRRISLRSFICEHHSPGEQVSLKSINALKKDFDDAESLAAYHKRWSPWVFDKDSGDLYTFDESKNSFALVPSNGSIESTNLYGTRLLSLSGKLIDNNTKLEITTVRRDQYDIDWDSEGYVLEEHKTIFDLEDKTIYREADEKTYRCIFVPIDEHEYLKDAI